jgi:hypothetical protein
MDIIALESLSSLSSIQDSRASVIISASYQKMAPMAVFWLNLMSTIPRNKFTFDPKAYKQGDLLVNLVIKKGNIEMSCTCGRSPTEKCVGWHKLSEADYEIKKTAWEAKKAAKKEAT